MIKGVNLLRNLRGEELDNDIEIFNAEKRFIHSLLLLVIKYILPGNKNDQGSDLTLFDCK